MGRNFSEYVMSMCDYDEERASLDFTWFEDRYTVTLDFSAVSNLGKSHPT